MRRILLVLSETAREKVKESSRRFKESKPGLRFQDHYHDRQQSNSGRYRLRVRIFCDFGGSLIVVGGIIAVPGPGPGWLIILLGSWMLAGELLFFARFMDMGEVNLRRLAQRVVGIWTTSSALVKGLITLITLISSSVLRHWATGLLSDLCNTVEEFYAEFG